MAPRWGGLRPEPYDPDARDADGDGVVQEQTAWERPVGTNLVDELGRAITRGSNVGARPRGMRVVDSSGNDVDYTPTYARPGAAPGAERVGGATALADHGAGSLKERGLPSVRAVAAPRVPEPEKPEEPDGIPKQAVITKALKADITPAEGDLEGDSSFAAGSALTDGVLTARSEADQSWREVEIITSSGETVKIKRDLSPNDGMPIIDEMGAEAPEIKMQNAREIGAIMAQNLSVEELNGFLPGFVVTINQDGLVRLAPKKGEGVSLDDRVMEVDPSTSSYKELLSEAIASNMIEGWATMGGAEELHASISRVFGSEDPIGGGMYITPDDLRNDIIQDANRQKVVDALVEAAYENTQRRLKEQGITEMTLHRGMHLRPGDSELAEYIYSRKSPDRTEFQENLEIALRPISSFSYNIDTAQYSFGEYGAPGGTLISTVVPADRIFSLATTGFGCREEDEIMVIGGGNISGRLRWTLERGSTGGGGM
jgi:hypothetical protein